MCWFSLAFTLLKVCSRKFKFCNKHCLLIYYVTTFTLCNITIYVPRQHPVASILSSILHAILYLEYLRILMNTLQYVEEKIYTICGTPTYVAPEIISEDAVGYVSPAFTLGNKLTAIIVYFHRRSICFSCSLYK